MNGLYVHAATLLMDGAADPAAPGAAVTNALCGHWEHPPPCLLAAHHTGWSRDGDRVSLRIVFATAPASERKVRGLIDTALVSGAFDRPDGTVSRWTLVTSGPAELSGPEREHAERISGT
ncbi:putative uncharacterized protein [Pseudarthrobacter siccitolerans]|uniref:Uncharacterized protein n=1 Tax=Pseudarthrobacter siccitolerans TaxID=861266 RepID=A0A024H7Z7_9MICC|nr:hypothetical protein [Pseudarthrobacter siccitolerans]CCQ47962.1 putative uncharacterized protein [Pseudarthrobacter siccitolerans]